MHPMAQTDRHLEGHGKSRTESAKWGQLSERFTALKNLKSEEKKQWDKKRETKFNNSEEEKMLTVIIIS